MKLETLEKANELKERLDKVNKIITWLKKGYKVMLLKYPKGDYLMPIIPDSEPIDEEVKVIMLEYYENKKEKLEKELEEL